MFHECVFYVGVDWLEAGGCTGTRGSLSSYPKSDRHFSTVFLVHITWQLQLSSAGTASLFATDLIKLEPQGPAKIVLEAIFDTLNIFKFRISWCSCLILDRIWRIPSIPPSLPGESCEFAGLVKTRNVLGPSRSLQISSGRFVPFDPFVPFVQGRQCGLFYWTREGLGRWMPLGST